MDPQLKDFISKHLLLGTPKEEIRKMLINTGWDAQQVDAALAEPQSPFIPGATHLRGPIELLKASIGIIKNRFWKLLGVVLIPSAIIFGLAMGGGMLAFFQRNLFSTFTLGAIVAVIILVIVFAVILILLGGVIQLGAVYAIADNTLSLKQIFAKAWHNLFAFWWVSFLSGFIIMGGFLLLFIPGVLFSLWFCLTTFVFIFENDRGMNALLKSKEYIKGYGSAVFFRFLALYIFALALVLLLSIVSNFFSNSFRTGYEIAINILSLLSTPVVLAYTYSIYQDLRAIKGPMEFDASKHNKVIYIVLAVLGIILMLAVPFIILYVSLQPGKMMERARETQQKAEVSQIKMGLEQYKAVSGSYPLSLNDITDYVPLVPAGIDYTQTENGQNYQLCIITTDSRTCYDSKYTGY